MRQLVPTLDYAAIEECDWALEAATENLKLKRHIFAVTHFFAPAFRNPAVEVVRDAPCFMLDRVFDNWCNEAACFWSAQL